jgi:hypothetical protein
MKPSDIRPLWNDIDDHSIILCNVDEDQEYPQSRLEVCFENRKNILIGDPPRRFRCTRFPFGSLYTLEANNETK